MSLSVAPGWVLFQVAFIFMVKFLEHPAGVNGLQSLFQLSGSAEPVPFPCN